MHRLVQMLKLLPSRTVARVFTLRNIVRARLAGGRLRIFVSSSKPAWLDAIEDGFRGTGHSVTFGDIHDADASEYDLVLPVTLEDVLHMCTDPVAADGSGIIPAADCIDLCDDKHRLNRTLQERGFGGSVPQIGSSLPFPYIVKKSRDAWGKNSHVVTDEETARGLADLAESPDYFTQEFVVGRSEYATHILFRDGKVARSLTIKYTYPGATPIKGKDRLKRKVIVRSRHLDLFTDILRSIGFQGICCVNYKTRNGSPMLLEINPRLGGSLCPYLPYFVEELG